VIEILGSLSLFSYAVLFVLLGFSFISWAIIFQKFSLFRKAMAEDRQFTQLYWKVADLVDLRRASMRLKLSPVARVFLSGIERLDPSFSAKSEDEWRGIGEGERKSTLKILERTLRRSVDEQVSELESYLSFLATTGNVSPFIGLFGTVIGIINAFQGISHQGTASIAAVAPGVSEALVATAAGLLAAIPAVVAYNYYYSRIRIISSEMETFSTDFLSLVEERMVQPGIPERSGGE